MPTFEPVRCPYPDCQTEFIPTRKDPTRCQKCCRSLDSKTVASATARANGQALRKKKRPQPVQVPSAKAQRGTKQVLAERGPTCAKEALTAARLAMRDEPDELPWPTEPRRWSIDIGLD